MSARQTKIIFPGEAAPCVMLDVKAIRSKLPGQDEDDIKALIEEDGKLPWAWNIGLGAARDVRVLARCVEHLAETGRALKLPWKVVLEEIFRGCHKPFLTGKQIAIILNCGTTQIARLIAAGDLQELAGTRRSTGPKGSALISCDSFVNFLSGNRCLNLDHQLERGRAA